MVYILEAFRAEIKNLKSMLYVKNTEIILRQNEMILIVSCQVDNMKPRQSLLRAL